MNALESGQELFKNGDCEVKFRVSEPQSRKSSSLFAIYRIILWDQPQNFHIWQSLAIYRSNWLIFLIYNSFD